MCSKSNKQRAMTTNVKIGTNLYHVTLFNHGMFLNYRGGSVYFCLMELFNEKETITNCNQSRNKKQTNKNTEMIAWQTRTPRYTRRGISKHLLLTGLGLPQECQF